MKIHGHLELQGLGQIKNLIVEKVGNLNVPEFGPNDLGRLLVNEDTGKFLFGGATGWVEVADASDTASVDAINAIFGALVDENGEFDADGVNIALENVDGAADLYEVLADLDAAISQLAGAAKNLGELTDVNDEGGSTDINVVNVLVGDGEGGYDVTSLTATVESLNHTSDVTGPIQAQLNDKMDSSETLEKLAGVELGVGDIIVAVEGDEPGDVVCDVITTTEFGRSLLVAEDAGGFLGDLGLEIGVDVQAHSDTLDALATFNTNGFVVQTGTNTFEGRSIEGTEDRIVVQDGDGVGGNPVLDLAEVTQENAGNFVKVIVDNYGRVTGNTNVVAADLTGLLGSVYVPLTGAVMEGFLELHAEPAEPMHAVNKGYVDARLAGLKWKRSARVATTENIADLAAGAPNEVDGVELAVGDRVLVREQTDPTLNGIYVVVVLGDGTDGEWERAEDFNDVSPINEITAAAVWVEEGEEYSNTGWTVISTVNVLGVDDIIFSQFNGASGITAGVGLDKVGNTLSVKLGAGIAALPTNEVGVDVRADGGLLLTVDGTTSSTDTGAQLAVKLDGTTLAKSANGLKVNADSITATELADDAVTEGKIADGAVTEVKIDDGAVTNAKLANSSITFVDGDDNEAEVALGESLNIVGVDGVVVTAAGDTVSVGVSEASTSVKGVAAFDPAHFNVTDGVVSLASAPSKIYHLYESTSASLSHEVVHNIGQKYCSVTVVDTTDEVIIPQSIVFNDTNTLTVSFNTAVSCKVIVVGTTGA